MAPFLEETIRSVLSQDYPSIEYLVIDGGSTDGSLDILRKYEEDLYYESHSDQGQADAINRGLSLSRGQVFAYLNADDTYLPGAIRAAVEQLLNHPEVAVVYGDAHWTDEKGQIIGPYPVQPFDPEAFAKNCYICQPAAFMRSDIVKSIGGFNSRLHFALDYDLWIRIAKRYPMRKINQFLANSRMHRGNKTLGDRQRVFSESIAVIREHFGYVPFNVLYGYASSRADRGDNFFEPVRASNVTFAMSLLLGSFYNLRHLRRFWKEATREIASGIAKRLGGLSESFR